MINAKNSAAPAAVSAPADLDIVLPRTIAFYLPQFHAIPENDEWWGTGFTEWTNVRRAEPMFDGHYQPRTPAELGYYDLQQAEVMERQAALARLHGVFGFCYYYYWFAGRRLLEKPLDRMLASGAPDFPFCLCWANENWSRRWDGGEQDVLIQQTYEAGYAEAIFRDLLPYLQDKRYITIGGKPVLLVYRTDVIPDCVAMTAIWRKAAEAAGLPGLYLVRVECFVNADPRQYGFDAASEFPPHLMYSVPSVLVEETPGRDAEFRGQVFDYCRVARHYANKLAPLFKRFKCVVPAWDNTARWKLNSHILNQSSPALYQAWLTQCLRETVRRFEGDERLVFINAWNEWGEGCYLEPDEVFGRKYLEATRDAVSKISGEIFAGGAAQWDVAGLGRMDFARALYDDGRYAEANDVFVFILSGNPANSIVLVYLGLIALVQSNSDGACEFFNRAMQCSTDCAATEMLVREKCFELGQQAYIESWS